MGKIIVEKNNTNTNNKKKKGRPSLLDLQKRTLKLHKQFLNKNNHNKLKKPPNFQNPNNPNSNSNSNSSIVRRSNRRNLNPNPNSDDDDDFSSSGNIRREKKLNLFLNLPNKNQNSNDDDDDDNSPGSNPRKRKIHSISTGSTVEHNFIKGEKHSADAIKQLNNQQDGGGSNLDDDGPSTSLPDKSLLLFILDGLQKKDTYGVFAEPVDPEELPDYHEVIEHPMDFGTVKNKLDEGAYASLEDFEKDVYLICSNAMQYNAQDTIYFRQARSIQELAKRNFENLRADREDNGTKQEQEPEPKVVRRGRPPTKNLKRPPGRPPLERASSNFSEATMANTGGTANRCNSEMRKSSHTEKFGSSDTLARSLNGTHYGEAYSGRSAERYERADDITGSALKGLPVKYWKKHVVVDERKRNTYLHSCELACGQESSVLSTFDRERKQLIAVGLHTEYGYARSLVRFTATLGPVAWKVASKKIERCLPAGVKFGPGWVGEDEAPAETPVEQELPASAAQQTPSSLPAPTNLAPSPSKGMRDTNGEELSQKPQVGQLPETQKPFSESKGKESIESHALPVACNDATAVCSSTFPSNGAVPEPEPNLIASKASTSSPSSTLANISNNGTGSLRPENPYPIHQTSIVQSRVNGCNGSYGVNLAAQLGKMVGGGRPTIFNLQTNSSIVTVSRTHTQCPQPPAVTDNKRCGEAKLGNNITIRSNDCLPNTGSSQNGGTPPDLNVGFQSPRPPVSRKADALQPDLALQL